MPANPKLRSSHCDQGNDGEPEVKDHKTQEGATKLTPLKSGKCSIPGL